MSLIPATLFHFIIILKTQSLKSRVVPLQVNNWCWFGVCISVNNIPKYFCNKYHFEALKKVIGADIGFRSVSSTGFMKYRVTRFLLTCINIVTKYQFC